MSWFILVFHSEEHKKVQNIVIKVNTSGLHVDQNQNLVQYRQMSGGKAVQS